MKAYFGLILLTLCLLISACDSEDAMDFDHRVNTETIPQQPGVHFRDILIACNGISPKVEIDTTLRQVKVVFTDWVDLSKMRFSIKTTPNTTLVFPEQPVVTLDATQPITLQVNEGGEEFSYTLLIDAPQPVDPTQLGWKVKMYENLPEYIKVFTSPEQLQNVKSRAFIVELDPKKGAAIEVLGEAEGLKKPSTFYNENEKPAIVMNAGFFTWSASQKKNLSTCILVRDGQTLCMNSQSVTRNGKTFYPTRSAFGIEADGSMSIQWVYSSDLKTTYAYPELAMNNITGTPLAKPSASFPEYAQLWSPRTAIGAGPTLLKEGLIRNHYNEECFDGISPTTQRARSAIGITYDGKVLLFVCEEDTAEGKGLTLLQLANIMQELGCKEAMNLDGGGSSYLLVNGTETIRPGDTSGEREVSTVIAVR